MNKTKIRERMKEAAKDQGDGDREAEFRCNRYWLILHYILEAPEPAAGHWRYDVENAPEGEELLCHWHDRTTTGFHTVARGWYSHGREAGVPIAWAPLNNPEKSRKLALAQVVNNAHTPGGEFK